MAKKPFRFVVFQGWGDLDPRSPYGSHHETADAMSLVHIGSYIRFQPKICSPPNSIQSSAQMGRGLVIGDFGLSRYIHIYVPFVYVQLMR